uniref:Uncharacterized protein n=1 Tax=Cacopsylla melanoneura TaxID=428564 RepID=A0A8D9E2Q4_9HEMI
MNELNRVTLLVTVVTVVAWLSNIQPSLAQGYQPIVHYVLTPVEIFRIPRTDYQPQIQVVPQEEFGPLVLNHPSNEYFRNLLINPVSYDSVMPLSPTPVTIIPVPAVPCPETLADKKTLIRTPSEDVDILNNTITTDTNTTAAENEAMIARIIDDTIDTSNGTDADDETDDGSVEATTPRLRSEEKELNKTERIVSRRSPPSSTSLGVSSRPVRHPRPQYKHTPQPQRRYAEHNEHDGFDDDDNEDDYVINSSYSESESYEDDSDNDNNDHDLDTDDKHNSHHEEDHHSYHNHHTGGGDHHGGYGIHHNGGHIQNDRFLDDNEILGDLGDDLFRFDHKNTDHKVLDYKRTDKTTRPHDK